MESQPGIVKAAINLPGLPGTSERIIVVPVFEHGPQGPDAPGGSPGKYEVTLLFLRPGQSLPLHDINLDPDAVEGDSLIRWSLAPGTIALQLSAVTGDGRAVQFRFKENKAGFLARADAAAFEAASFDDAEATAYRALAPALSHWCTLLDTPIQVQRVYIKEVATQARRVSLDIAFPEVTFAPGSKGMAGAEYRMYVSLYREGLLSNRRAYQFLCFYKILEGISLRRKRIDTDAAATGQRPKREPERVPARYEELPTWLNALFFRARIWDEYSLRATVPQEALGKKVSILIDKFRVIRNEVGHTLTREGEPNSFVDDHFESPHLQTWLPLIRCIARLLIRNEFPQESGLSTQDTPPSFGSVPNK